MLRSMEIAMAAASDCELVGPGLLNQPVNAVSSLAFLVVSVVLFRQRPVLALVSAATGIGSFLYHGFGGGWAQWAHDSSLAWFVAGLALERSWRVLLAVAFAVGAWFAVTPSDALPAGGR
jgi:hypothetical protein